MTLNRHHRRAFRVLAATVALDIVLGVVYGETDNISVLHGLYCAIGTATTVGCDITPRTAGGYITSAVMMLSVVPLFAAVFSFFTTGLTADHVDKRHQELMDK
jgi:hypothetical protein